MANTKVKAEQLEAAQTNITSLGTLTSLTVDDITINGSTISDGGDLTLDIGGDINIDADGGDINLKDGGTLFGQISNSSGLYLVSSISDADIFIRGNDGGSMVNALTFDMSAGGNATFTGEVTFNKDIGLGMNGASFGSGTPTINFKGTSNANTRAGAINFKENNDDDVAALYVTDGSDGYGTVLAAYQGDIKFSTATLAGYKMTIKADGKVGIGTNSPVGPLTVYEASNSQMQFQTSGTGTGASDGTRFGYNGSGAQIWNFENNYVRFATNNVERIRLDSTGVLRLKAGTETIGSSAEESFITHDNAGNTSLRIGSNYSNDNAAIRLQNNTTEIAIFKKAGVTMPLQPSVMVQMSGDQSNIATTPTTLTFNAERYDQNSDFNTSTYTFTAPVTGKYLVCINLYMKNIDNAASYYQLYISSSNRTFYSIFDPELSNDAEYWNMAWSSVIDMDASDTVYFRLNQSGGAAQTDLDQVSNASISLLH